MTLISEPFEGKSFNLGVQDCFSLSIDFFKENFNIVIPNISRPHDWDADKLDLINDFYHLSGFKKIDAEAEWPPRPADVLVTTISGSNPNHLVIYLGSNEILHHPNNQLSKKEMMRPVWKRFTSYILRHPDVPDLSVTKPLIKLEDILDERFT